MPRLTDSVIKQAVVKPAQYEIKCTDHKGLRLVVWPSGNKSFIFRYTFADKYRKLTLGEYGPNDMTLAKAHAAVTAAKDALDAGRDPKADKRPKADADDSLAAYIAIYTRDHVSTLRPGVAAYVKAELDRFQDQCPGKTLAQVTKGDVIAAIDKARKRGPNAAVQVWKVVRGFLAWCEGWSKTDYQSPARAIPRPAPEVERDRVLADAELRTVWRTANGAGNFGKLVQLLMLTGCRRNEIAELSRAEITDTAIELPGERTKNGIPHTVTLTPMIRAVLDTLPEGGKYVLRRPGYPDRPYTGFSKAKRTFKDGLAKPWVLHDLRRSFASGLQRLGVLPHIIELCINHRSNTLGGIVKVYQRDKHAAEVAAAFKLWSDHIEGLISDRKLAA